jgi:C-terminal processing protease CtpA/Prc
MDFRNHTVRLAMVACLAGAALAGCADLVVNNPDHQDEPADFEQAWSIVNSVYPYFQFKHINWDSIHTVYAPLAEGAQDDRMFQVLFDMLAELKDGHVNLRTESGQEVRPDTPPRTERDRFTFDPLLVRKYFTEPLKLAGGDRMEYGILPDGIGYVRITTFENGSWIYDFDNVLSYLRDTKALIIDVRDNGGGSTTVSDVVVSRFLHSPLPYYPVYRGNTLQQIPPLQPRGTFTYSQRVIVLINGVCFSTTECFAEMMKQIQTVTVVGDTTGGGGGAPQYYSLPSGRAIRVSTKNICRYDGLPVEWNGVPPDVVLLQTRDDVKNGHDLQLERANGLLQ